MARQGTIFSNENNVCPLDSPIPLSLYKNLKKKQIPRFRPRLSPGSTLSRHFDTRSRHYPDTIPTPRHSDTSVNRHSARHSDTSVRPVSSHLDVGHQRMASSSVNGVKAKPTLRHSTPPTPPTPPTLDTPDTPTLQASMLTRCRPRC